MSGSMHWIYIGGRSLNIHRPVMMSFHLVKIVFPPYYTYAAYLSRVSVHPASHRRAKLRILFIRLVSVTDALALEGSLYRKIR